MDISVVSALITNVMAIPSTIIGVLMQERVKKITLPEQQIWYQTLTEVLVPLINALKEINEHTWDEKKQTMKKLLNQKQILIPPEIESLIEKTLSVSETTRYYAQEELLKVTESYAHWYRKKLKYPYNDEKINLSHVPDANKKQNIKIRILTFIFTSWVFCNLCMGGLGAYSLINRQPVNIEPWFIMSITLSVLILFSPLFKE